MQSHYSWMVLTNRFWIYQDHFLRGPYAPGELAGKPEFSASLLVCQEGDDLWRPAQTVLVFQPFLPARIVSTGDYQDNSSADSPVRTSSDAVL